LSAVGLVVGTGAAMLAAYPLRSFLLGVPAWDPGSVGATALVVLAASCSALVQPAVSAGRSDPADLLRAE
jgi:hypothetical protein